MACQTQTTNKLRDCETLLNGSRKNNRRPLTGPLSLPLDAVLRGGRARGRPRSRRPGMFWIELLLEERIDACEGGFIHIAISAHQVLDHTLPQARTRSHFLDVRQLPSTKHHAQQLTSSALRGAAHQAYTARLQEAPAARSKRASEHARAHHARKQRGGKARKARSQQTDEPLHAPM